MGMAHLMSAVNSSPGLLHHGNEAPEETKDLGKLRAAAMVEKCQIKEEVLRCPIPRKSSSFNREHELRIIQDHSDIIASKASPPYFVGSPPVRASNPLVHDSKFRQWEVQSAQQSPGIPIPTKGLNFRWDGMRNDS